MPSKDPEVIKAKNARYREKYREEIHAKARLKREEAAKRRGKDYNPRDITPYDRRLSKLKRQEQFHQDPTDPRHGTINGYHNLKCRCVRCKAANTKYHGEYRARKQLELLENPAPDSWRGDLCESLDTHLPSH